MLSDHNTSEPLSKPIGEELRSGQNVSNWSAVLLNHLEISRVDKFDVLRTSHARLIRPFSKRPPRTANNTTFLINNPCMSALRKPIFVKAFTMTIAWHESPGVILLSIVCTKFMLYYYTEESVCKIFFAELLVRAGTRTRVILYF